MGPRWRKSMSSRQSSRWEEGFLLAGALLQGAVLGEVPLRQKTVRAVYPRTHTHTAWDHVLVLGNRFQKSEAHGFRPNGLKENTERSTSHKSHGKCICNSLKRWRWVDRTLASVTVSYCNSLKRLRWITWENMCCFTNQLQS
jgi:hypothetical protein